MFWKITFRYVAWQAASILAIWRPASWLPRGCKTVRCTQLLLSGAYPCYNGQDPNLSHFFKKKGSTFRTLFCWNRNFNFENLVDFVWQVLLVKQAWLETLIGFVWNQIESGNRNLCFFSGQIGNQKFDGFFPAKLAIKSLTGFFRPNR